MGDAGPDREIGRAPAVGRFAFGLAISAPVITFANLALRPIQAGDALGRFAFGDYLGLRLISTTLALAAILGLAMAASPDRGTLASALALGVAKAFEAVSDVVLGRFQRGERLDLVARSQVSRGVLSAGFVAAALAATGRVEIAAIGIAVAGALVLIVHDLPMVASLDAPIPRFRAEVLRSLAWLALPLGVATMLSSLNANLPRYFLERSRGGADLGAFAALAYLATAGTTAISALGQAATPGLARSFASGDLRGFRRSMRRDLSLGIAVGLAGLAGSIGLGGPILSALYRPEFAAYASILPIVMMAAAFEYVGSLMGYGLTAARSFRVQPWLFGASAAVMAMSCGTLVPRFGPAGAAWSLAIASAFGMVATTACLAFALRRSAREFRR